MAYAELHCLSNYSFLRGASHPDELVEMAIKRGYSGIAITDECSLAGVVKLMSRRKSMLSSSLSVANLPYLKD